MVITHRYRNRPFSIEKDILSAGVGSSRTRTGYWNSTKVSLTNRRQSRNVGAHSRYSHRCRTYRQRTFAITIVHSADTYGKRSLFIFPWVIQLSLSLSAFFLFTLFCSLYVLPVSLSTPFLPAPVASTIFLTRAFSMSMCVRVGIFSTETDVNFCRCSVLRNYAPLRQLTKHSGGSSKTSMGISRLYQCSFTTF